MDPGWSRFPKNRTETIATVRPQRCRWARGSLAVHAVADVFDRFLARSVFGSHLANISIASARFLAYRLQAERLSDLDKETVPDSELAGWG